MRVRHWRAAAAPTRALPYPHAFLRSRTAQPARTAVRRTVGRVVASTPAPASAGRSSVVIVLGSVLTAAELGTVEIVSDRFGGPDKSLGWSLRWR